MSFGSLKTFKVIKQTNYSDSKDISVTVDNTECDLTQEKLSEKVGKQRSTVTNFLRLLKKQGVLKCIVSYFILNAQLYL